MRRLLRIRLLVVLAALLIIPAFTLPFAARLREEWTRFWEPKLRGSVAAPVVGDDPRDAQRRAFFQAIRRFDVRASADQGLPGGGRFQGGADEIGPVKIEFVEGNDVIVIGSPNLPPIDTDSGGSNAAVDAQRRAFFEALHGGQSGGRSPSPPIFEPRDVKVPLKPREEP